MQELRKIWAFGLPYLRPYMFRFVAGVVLGIVFGISNGLFVISVDALFTRLTQPTPLSQQIQANPPNLRRTSQPAKPTKTGFYLVENIYP